MLGSGCTGTTHPVVATFGICWSCPLWTLISFSCEKRIVPRKFLPDEDYLDPDVLCSILVSLRITQCFHDLQFPVAFVPQHAYYSYFLGLKELVGERWSVFNGLLLKGFLWCRKEYYVDESSSLLLWVIGDLSFNNESPMTPFIVPLQDDT